MNARLESDLTSDQGIYDFALSYHIGDRPIPYQLTQPSKAAFPRIWFAPILGTRLNDLSSTIETTLTFERLERTVEDTRRGGRTWFEPLVGGKFGLQISEPITFWARGDVSGFGLAGETDLSWNAIFGLDWWVNPNISLNLASGQCEVLVSVVRKNGQPGPKRLVTSKLVPLLRLSLY